jgi:formylglycine-generating enzyme required for sulfatase activity
MHGNALEWCLDWYAADISTLNGAVNANGLYLADGTTAGENRVRRSGYFLSGINDCRSATRGSAGPRTLNDSWSTIRPAAPAVAK